jgi:hypothetical protein
MKSSASRDSIKKLPGIWQLHTASVYPARAVKRPNPAGKLRP